VKHNKEEPSILVMVAQILYVVALLAMTYIQGRM